MSAGVVYSFGPFQLDARSNQLTRGGERVAIGDRHATVLHHLLANAGSVASKDALISAAWGDVAVTDNSLEQVISALRRLLGDDAKGQPYVETVPRRGYRFAGDVSRVVRRESDETLDDLLAPHRAWIEGRAALETLERDRIVHARGVFETVLRASPEQASAHVGLANACWMQFEMTRADETPDLASLTSAAEHAREACRLDAQYGDAWATLGVVLERSGNAIDALAASKRAVTLEPDNWRHHFRLALVGWGEERLRAARRTLSLLPGFPLAHWLAATVHVARNALGEATRELEAGIAADDKPAKGSALVPRPFDELRVVPSIVEGRLSLGTPRPFDFAQGRPEPVEGRAASRGDIPTEPLAGEHSRFSGVALHWLLGLIHLSLGDEERALAEFDRELAREASGHLYARECCANTWYAIGAMRLRQGHPLEAAEAFGRAIERVARHPMARLGLACGTGRAVGNASGPGLDSRLVQTASVDLAVLEAARLVLAGAHEEGARVIDASLATAAPGPAGWLLPVEPMLHIAARPTVWAAPLARLRARAA